MSEPGGKLDRRAGMERQGIINLIRRLVNSRVEESKLPTKDALGYESSMGVYGGKLVSDDEGKMVYDVRGLWSKLDQLGDRLLRTFDEHHMKQPLRMAWNHPAKFIKFLPFLADSKRYRGTPEQTMANVKRMGLGDLYGAHPWGIEIKEPEVFRQSIGLQDIYHQDEIQSPVLDTFDRFEATGLAVDYMRQLHDATDAGIAEGNVYSFLFTEHDADGHLGKPAIMIPTEVFNPDKNISKIEQKTTDLLDFLASVGMEEWRRTQDWTLIERAWTIALDHYRDADVIHMVASYIKRGRLTLPGDEAALSFDHDVVYSAMRPVAAAHNTQRLGVNADIATELRTRLTKHCEDFIPPLPPDNVVLL